MNFKLHTPHRLTERKWMCFLMFAMCSFISDCVAQKTTRANVTKTRAKNPAAAISVFGPDQGHALTAVHAAWKDSRGHLWCALIKMGLENREIALLLNIEASSVKMAKYRLKKKFNIDESVSLRAYFETL